MPSTNVTYVTEFAFSDFFKLAKSALNLIDDTKKSTGQRRRSTTYNMSSIAQAAKNLTMSFPVLCSDTIEPSTASIITKAIERNNVSMLQMLISAYHIQADNGIDAIQMIHTNLDNSFRAEDLIDATIGTVRFGKGIMNSSGASTVGSAIKSAYFEASDYYKDHPASAGIYLMALEECTRVFLASLGKVYPESSFSENSIADYNVSTNRYGNVEVVKEIRAGGVWGAFDPEEDYNARSQAASRAEENRRKAYEDSRKDANDKYNSKQKAYKDQEELIGKTMDRMRAIENDIRKAEMDRAKLDLDRKASVRDLFTKQLLDSDVKKANELQPTLMVVPFYYTVSTGKDSYDERSQEFIAGVKARLITCTSEEIIDQISRFNKQGVNINNLIRATTSEISFSKEFVGGIEQAKIDAKKDSKLSRTNPIWRTLQARSSRSGIKRLLRGVNSKNAAAAITTLVMTAQEADYIAENYGVDITNPVIAREFMENYNLLCLVIVDEQIEVAKFIYDGENYFTDYSFNALERDNNANDTRKLISLLNKTR